MKRNFIISAHPVSVFEKKTGKGKKIIIITGNFTLSAHLVLKSSTP